VFAGKAAGLGHLPIHDHGSLGEIVGNVSGNWSYVRSHHAIPLHQKNNQFALSIVQSAVMKIT
jgi:hypothetical protein